MKLYTFLNYGGNCEKAFRFYEQQLGGKITKLLIHGQQPGAQDVPPDQANSVLHARIVIGDSEIMGSDVPAQHFQPMRSVYLTLAFTSVDEAERTYALLAEDGDIFMPMQDTPFGVRFGMLRDKFGTSWMILHEPSAPAPAHQAG